MTELSLDKQFMALDIDQSGILNVSFQPANATNKTLTWTSSDYTIATLTNLNNLGYVTGHAADTATITASSEEGFSVSCTVVVNPKLIQATSLDISKSTTTLNVGASETLAYSYSPVDAEAPTLNWSSSDSSVVTVDNTGKITAKKWAYKPLLSQHPLFQPAV